MINKTVGLYLVNGLVLAWLYVGFSTNPYYLVPALIIGGVISLLASGIALMFLSNWTLNKRPGIFKILNKINIIFYPALYYAENAVFNDALKEGAILRYEGIFTKKKYISMMSPKGSGKEIIACHFCGESLIANAKKCPNCKQQMFPSVYDRKESGEALKVRAQYGAKYM